MQFSSKEPEEIFFNLLTWNFKHIANAAIRANVELVCRLNNYEPPVICSPMELMEA